MIDKPTRIILGIDPAHDATGLALMLCNPAGPPAWLWSSTLAPLTHEGIEEACTDIRTYLDVLLMGRHLDGIGCEAPFVMPANVRAGLNMARAMEFCLTHVWLHFGPLPVFEAPANSSFNKKTKVVQPGWRQQVFGSGFMRTKDAKRVAWDWAGDLPGCSETATEHEREAAAIAQAANIKLPWDAAGVRHD